MASTTANWEVWKPEIEAYIKDEQDNMPKSVYRDIFSVETTNRLTTPDKGWSGYNPMEEVGEMGDAVSDEAIDGYKFTYSRRSYRKSATFSSDLMETDQTGEVIKKAKSFANVTEYSRNLHAFSVIRRMTDATKTYGDSAPLVGAHVRKDGGGTQYNTFTDLVQRPLTYDNVLALQDVLISNVSNSGNLMTAGDIGRNKVLFGSPYLRETLFQIAGVEGPDMKPGTDENDANYIRKGDKFDVLILPWITYEAAKQAGETGSITKSSNSNYWDKMWGIMDVNLVKSFFRLLIAEGYEKYDEEITKSNQALTKYVYDKYDFGVSNWMGFAGSLGNGTELS